MQDLRPADLPQRLYGEWEKVRRKSHYWSKNALRNEVYFWLKSMRIIVEFSLKISQNLILWKSTVYCGKCAGNSIGPYLFKRRRWRKWKNWNWLTCGCNRTVPHTDLVCNSMRGEFVVQFWGLIETVLRIICRKEVQLQKKKPKLFYFTVYIRLRWIVVPSKWR